MLQYVTSHNCACHNVTKCDDIMPNMRTVHLLHIQHRHVTTWMGSIFHVLLPLIPYCWLGFLLLLREQIFPGKLPKPIESTYWQISGVGICGEFCKSWLNSSAEIRNVEIGQNVSKCAARNWYKSNKSKLRILISKPIKSSNRPTFWQMFGLWIFG